MPHHLRGYLAAVDPPKMLVVAVARRSADYVHVAHLLPLLVVDHVRYHCLVHYVTTIHFKRRLPLYSPHVL
jgi:hypothetical protein